MYKVPRRLRVPISLNSWRRGIETESVFQDKLEKRFAFYCIITAFLGLGIGFLGERALGPDPVQAADFSVGRVSH